LFTKHATRAHFLAPRLSTNKAPGRIPTQPFFTSLVACEDRRTQWWSDPGFEQTTLVRMVGKNASYSGSRTGSTRPGAGARSLAKSAIQMSFLDVKPTMAAGASFF
jgi:hypothetical protein